MAFNLKNVSILVVEDLRPMRSLIAAVLDALGIGKIYEAPHGEKAYELYQQLRPDIIITDWLMEPMNGLEFIKKVRQSPESSDPQIPIIVITGYSAYQRVIQARDLGATEFLTKPFTGLDLAKRINQIINKPRDFVHSGSFFGPDRRRRKNDRYQGPMRREGEASQPGQSGWYLDGEKKSPPPESEKGWDIIVR